MDRQIQDFPDWLYEISPHWPWQYRHIQFVLSQLENFINGDVDRLILTLPPRHYKTELVTVRLSAYLLERTPNLPVIIGAYNQTLAERFSRKIRRIVEGRLPLATDRQAVGEWETAQGGGVRAAGVGSGVTGMGAGLIVIDDPVKSREEAESESYRDRCWNWYTDDIYTRCEPGAKIIVIQTRWHEDDLTGRLLAAETQRAEEGEPVEGWRVINLPALCEDPDTDSLGRCRGEALNPERYNEEALARIKATMGSYSFNALYQGSPTAAEGNLFRRDWWQYYGGPDDEELPEFDIVVQSWDMAFEKTDGSDYVVGGVWGHAGHRKYLLDLSRARADFVESKQMVRNLLTNWPETSLCYIEKKANGPAVMSELRHEFKQMPFVGVDPKTSKLARAFAVSPQVERGEVYLPRDYLAPWMDEYLKELSSFPKGAHDDQVDMMTQALSVLAKMDSSNKVKKPPKRDDRTVDELPGMKVFGGKPKGKW